MVKLDENKKLIDKIKEQHPWYTFSVCDDATGQHVLREGVLLFINRIASRGKWFNNFADLELHHLQDIVNGDMLVLYCDGENAEQIPRGSRLIRDASHSYAVLWLPAEEMEVKY
jgi:hypothetical protein